MRFTPPEEWAQAFTCPTCGALAQQSWYRMGTTYATESTCQVCQANTVWYYGKMLYPVAADAPMAHTDMPDSIKADYDEARSILSLSPRGAAALLRVAIDKLTIELGATEATLDKRIGQLVASGLDVRIQMMLDTVRVVGNNAVHPGLLDVNDDPELVAVLFALINEIVDELITKPKQLQSLFSKLPEGARLAIERRDKKT